MVEIIQTLFQVDVAGEVTEGSSLGACRGFVAEQNVGKRRPYLQGWFQASSGRVRPDPIHKPIKKAVVHRLTQASDVSSTVKQVV